MNENEIPAKEFIFGSIFALSNRLQKLGDQLDDYMTMKQWLLIAAITKSGEKVLTIGEAADIIGTSHQNVKKMALLLQEQGFLTLAAHPKDKRSTVITLTEYCHDYFLQREAVEISFLNAVFQDFDEDSINGLYNGLRLLQHNIESMEGQVK